MPEAGEVPPISGGWTNRDWGRFRVNIWDLSPQPDTTQSFRCSNTPQIEEVLKSEQTCLAVFADFGTELRSGESFDCLVD